MNKKTTYFSNKHIKQTRRKTKIYLFYKKIKINTNQFTHI